MKVINKISITLLTTLLLASCSVQVKSHKNHKHQHGKVKSNGNQGMPPGQVKKVTGTKSAKEYAPGHNKRKQSKKHKY
ncbi:hypothetical protein [Myroides phaeus]|uniref:Lipoprotein n=1 Tax=Myroides phaeus TaxID=702745 RepID=A0A1G8EKT3_9FLAO|nr:hypothetical protein [Myroides phaeus]SDH70451.1 hypothetical protein SAMN05421818_11162 [Myroides phaeus]